MNSAVCHKSNWTHVKLDAGFYIQRVITENSVVMLNSTFEEGNLLSKFLYSKSTPWSWRCAHFRSLSLCQLLLHTAMAEGSSVTLFVITWHLTPLARCLSVVPAGSVRQISMIKVSLSALTWVSRRKGEWMHLLAPLQIDLIKDMAAHLLPAVLWSLKGRPAGEGKGEEKPHVIKRRVQGNWWMSF